MKNIKTMFGLPVMFTLLVTFSALAQQDPLYSQYLYNGLALNPAYAGSRGSISGVLFYRQQWVGVEGAPTSQNLSVHSPLDNDKYAVGLNISTDKVGLIRQTLVNGSYAYRIKLNNSMLSMGVQATFQQVQADFNSVGTNQGSDPSFLGNNLNTVLPNFGSGIYYYNKRFFAGFSCPNILNHNLYKANLDSNFSKLVRHFYGTVGGVVNIDEDWKFKPSAMLKIAKATPVQADLNASVIYQDFIIGGVSLRNMDAVAASCQVFLGKRWWVGYAHDWSVNGLNTYNHGTHEIFLGFDYFLKKPVIQTPRYF